MARVRVIARQPIIACGRCDMRVSEDNITAFDEPTFFVRQPLLDDLLSLPRLLLSSHATNILALLDHQTLQALVRSSPELASQPEFQALSNLRGVDVVAVRLFFKSRLDMPRAASVAGGGMAPGKLYVRQQATRLSVA